MLANCMHLAQVVVSQLVAYEPVVPCHKIACIASSTVLRPPTDCKREERGICQLEIVNPNSILSDIPPVRRVISRITKDKKYCLLLSEETRYNVNTESI